MKEKKMEQILKLMNQNPVFSVLPDSKKVLVYKDAITQKYKKGEKIVFEGDHWPYLFLLVEGSVNAIKSSMEGRNLVVTTFTKGSIFWGLAFFFNDLSMFVSLEAAEDTQLMLWKADRLVPVLKSEGASSWELSKLMVSNMMRASEILEEMTFQPVAGRLAKLLIETVRDQKDGPVTRSLTLDEMAARIGSTREMVCRFLHRFADDGIIDITRTEFKVTDPKKLANMARNSKG
jgi:CRP/FNR family transcriptional regulator